ncbi:MAG TPA: hypothetical protein VNJ53_14030 [Gaiellaceae bacterium]|nr:hypothetical protein [Gaiellaceae bacterium]
MGAPTDARRALLERLFDHAPLFPPASLPPGDAVAEDERARSSPEAALLGRFVCPASLLADLPLGDRALSVVLDGPLRANGRVQAVELAYPEDEGALRAAVALAPEAYVEVPLDGALESRLDRLAELAAGAKVRCGGAAVPAAEDLWRFLAGCRERGLPFKATAGLHHALPSAGEHGFLCLLAAAVFAEPDALEEEDASSFRLSADAFSWRERSVGPADLLRARRDGLRAIGSCSFFEPVAELRALGMLPG